MTREARSKELIPFAALRSIVQTVNIKRIARTNFFFNTYFHPEVSTRAHVAQKNHTWSIASQL